MVSNPGNFELLKEILANANLGQIQLSVNKQNTLGWAPLLAAASRGHIDIVNSLLECNARSVETKSFRKSIFRVDVFENDGKYILFHL